MGTLLARAGSALLAVACAGAVAAQEPSDRHQWRIEIDAGYVGADSPLGSWPSGGLGKLRYDETDEHLNAMRVFAQYKGRITPTLSTTVVADYVEDGSGGLDLTEAFLDWRPIPRSPIQQQVRVGAFYPPLSLENGEAGWQSPFTYSYSAINTWLSEEIRPIGAEWSMRRRLGAVGSPQQLRAFASGFFANDPAGTLLFWRGWSLHDRQSRLNDKLSIPPMPVYTAGVQTGTRPHTLEPFEEIDNEPGVYAGLEWRYARRALVQVAYYDNRADPYAFADGQWAWGTAFTHLAAQFELPGEIGLVAQWMSGDTDWILGARPDGTRSSTARLVEDRFESKFLMLTRLVRGAHRLSLRYDDFEIVRDEAAPALQADVGHAWTVAYRYSHSARLTGGVEWLEIESRRDLWPLFYSAPHEATESQLRLLVSFNYGAPKTR